MARTKIVCTIGPASRDEATLEALLAEGMDAARLNFSHGTHAEHAQVMVTLRRLADARGRPVAILQDLQGPKIRLGRFAAGSVTLTPGAVFTVTVRDVPGTEAEAAVSFPGLVDAVRPGDMLLLRDGLVHLRVESVTRMDIRCRVARGGVVGDHTGVNVPGVALPIDPLTQKDRDDLLFGVAAGVDYVAVSFIRSADDVRRVKGLLAEHGRSVPIVAKIEKGEALEDIDRIAREADALMIARGDLGVELPLERVPEAQRTIIAAGAAARVPVITATQMLESMVEHPQPTRAEVTDVAHAIWEGSDAIMLSAETAAGAYPVEAVRTMRRIADEAERTAASGTDRAARPSGISVADAMCAAACRLAGDLSAVAVVAYTETGTTARLLSKYRPPVPIFAPTPRAETYRRLSLCWGVAPVMVPPATEAAAMVRHADEALCAGGLARPGDLVVLVSGWPLSIPGRTNLVEVHRIGEPHR